MLEIERKHFSFRTKEIWFSENPFDVVGYDSITFNDCKNRILKPEFSCTEQATLVLDLTQDLELIWANMRKTFRQNIKYAQRDGIKVRMNQAYGEFCSLNRSFKRAKGLPASSGWPWFSENVEHMKKYGTLFVSELDEVLSGQFYLEDEKCIRWLVGASKRLDVGMERTMLRMIGNANKLLTWEAIKYAKAKGLTEFDFGGYYTGKANDEMENINLFKEGFGGKQITRYGYQRDYSPTYTLARRVLRNLTSFRRKTDPNP